MREVGDLVRSRIRESVFGVQDGLVSTLGALTGIAVGTESRSVVILAGFVVVAVESLSMAAGSYLSSKSQREYLERLLREEEKSIAENPQDEHRELIEMYRHRGFTDEEIQIIARRLFADKRWLLEDMAHKELGICPARLEEPLSNAAVMGISYVVGGIVPVLPYVLFPISIGLPVSIFLTGIVLFGFGGVKGKLVHKSWMASGLEMLAIAGLACLIGLAIGTLARGIVP